MFVLAHVSDLHLAAPPRLAQLAGKRGLGFVNWHRGRKNIHKVEALDALTSDLKSFAVDHIAVTGDLVNLSLPGEYARARAWLEALGPPSHVTVIPGNHDIYVPGAVDGPSSFWGDYMRGDDGADAGAFPFVRRRGDVALIALSSALPTGPFMATGRLGTSQLARFATALDSTRGFFRIVLIHHPPVSPASRYLRRLTDADEFRRVLAQKGAELVLHGHDHRRTLVWLDGPEHPIPALGAPSASARVPHHGENAAGYNLLHLDGEAGRWRCELIARERDTDGVVRETERQMLGQ
ncbi:MAG: metallophosphatase [Proteobacteria bacterium]|nr:MAG: metallophosphatase [Pseudomonadota bacterium]